MQPLPTDFFISRAGADKDLAIAIAQMIRDAGCNTWLQDEDFGHASFMARMAQGFASGARMIALLCRTYQQSEYCKKEYEHVLADDPRNLHERLIVLRVEEVVPVEHLKELAYADLVPLLSDASEVARVVRVAIGLEKRPSEIDFAALYRRAPKILHPEVEAVPGFIGRERELDALDAALRRTDRDDAPTAALTDTTATAAMHSVWREAFCQHRPIP